MFPGGIEKAHWERMGLEGIKLVLLVNVYVI